MQRDRVVTEPARFQQALVYAHQLGVAPVAGGEVGVNVVEIARRAFDRFERGDIGLYFDLADIAEFLGFEQTLQFFF